MAKFTEGQPATSSARASAPVRDNLDALFQMDQKALRARAQASPNMTLAVAADQDVAYAKGSGPLNYAGGNSPTLTAPVSDNRISILQIDRTGTLSWVSGLEAGTPAEPVIDVGKLSLASVFCRVGMTQIKNADDATQGYLLKDRRPFIVFPPASTLLAQANLNITTNAGTDTVMLAVTVPGGSLGVRGMVRITVYLSVVTLTSGQSATLTLSWGGGILAQTSVAYAAGGAGAGALKIECVVAAQGSLSAQYGSILFVGTGGFTYDANHTISAAGNKDSTANQVMQLSVQMSSAADSAVGRYGFAELVV